MIKQESLLHFTVAELPLYHVQHLVT